MEDTVKYIFKTLIKVPCIIVASYLVFNIFCYGLISFKLLGVSYTVMQTAVENNYIPEEEKNTLEAYFQELDNSSELINNVGFTSDTDFAKHQYGSTVNVGVTADYKFILPLMPYQQTSDGIVAAGKTNKVTNWLSDSELATVRKANETENNITFSYTVPGLKYYPDMN